MGDLLSRWFGLDGKVAIVTGGGTGLGASFALALAEAGASVVVAGRRGDPLGRTVESIEAIGAAALAIEADVREPDAPGHIVAATVEAFGRLDTLVNNAAVNHLIPSLDEDDPGFRTVIDTNLVAPFAMAQAAARVMEPGSSIVNISSCSAFIRNGVPHAAYVSSKLGLVGLTYNLAAEWGADRGIRVNAIVPGYFPSELTKGRDPAIRAASIARRVPLGRDGDHAECAAAVVFLASDAASYVTGAVLEVDGGMLARMHDAAV
jgi:NAD(P)-dependent dehydrogenase (short-subunit alcohol dehydrogenase family)